MSHIASPCVNICTLDAAGDICLGCGRNRQEIGGWMMMSDNERADIMQRIAREKAEACAQ